MLLGESVTLGSEAPLVIPSRCLNPKRCLKTPHLWEVTITQHPPASDSCSPTLIYGQLNYLGTKQHEENSSCQERLGVPQTWTPEWEQPGLSLSLHHPPGTVFSGRAHQCRVWFLLTITSKAKPQSLTGGVPVENATEDSVLWPMGCWGLQYQRAWKHPVVSGCLEEQWGNSAALCLLMSVVPQGAVRAVEASLSSSQFSNHIIQRYFRSRATVPGP